MNELVKQGKEIEKQRETIKAQTIALKEQERIQNRIKKSNAVFYRCSRNRSENNPVEGCPVSKE